MLKSLVAFQKSKAQEPYLQLSGYAHLKIQKAWRWPIILYV